MLSRLLNAHSRRIARIAIAVAIAYSAIPTFGALHGAQHFAETLATAAPQPQQISRDLVLDREASGTCQICQASARSKHAGALSVVSAIYVHDHVDRVGGSSADAGACIGLAPRSSRAPPLL